LRFFFGFAAIAWALGFSRYLGAGSVSFPIFPNALDCLGLAVMGGYFVREAFKP
jgi:hypothetical protein